MMDFIWFIGGIAAAVLWIVTLLLVAEKAKENAGDSVKKEKEQRPEWELVKEWLEPAPNPEYAYTLRTYRRSAKKS